MLKSGKFEPHKAVISMAHSVEIIESMTFDTARGALVCTAPSLADIRKYHGKQTANDVLAVILSIINEALGSKKALTSTQLALFSRSIFNRYYYYKISEVKTVLMKGLTGELYENGQVIRFYGEPDLETVMSWFSAYDQERTDAAREFAGMEQNPLDVILEPEPQKLLERPVIDLNDIPEDERPKDQETGLEYLLRMIDKKSREREASVRAERLKMGMQFKSVQYFFLYTAGEEKGKELFEKVFSQWQEAVEGACDETGLLADMYLLMAENKALVYINDKRTAEEFENPELIVEKLYIEKFTDFAFRVSNMDKYKTDETLQG